jgi:hypothetical protein
MEEKNREAFVSFLATVAGVRRVLNKKWPLAMKKTAICQTMIIGGERMNADVHMYNAFSKIVMLWMEDVLPEAALLEACEHTFEIAGARELLDEIDGHCEKMDAIMDLMTNGIHINIDGAEEE